MEFSESEITWHNVANDIALLHVIACRIDTVDEATKQVVITDRDLNVLTERAKQLVGNLEKFERARKTAAPNTAV